MVKYGNNNNSDVGDELQVRNSKTISGEKLQYSSTVGKDSGNFLLSWRSTCRHRNPAERADYHPVECLETNTASLLNAA